MNTSDLVGQVAETLKGAGLAQLRAVDDLLHGLIDDVEPIPPDSRAVVVQEERRVGRVTYRLQGIRCSKDGCRCMKGGASHGPYWYGFYRQSGRVRSLYVGKAFKEAVRQADGTFIVERDRPPPVKSAASEVDEAQDRARQERKDRRPRACNAERAGWVNTFCDLPPGHDGAHRSGGAKHGTQWSDERQSAGIECPTCERPAPRLVTYRRQSDGGTMQVCEECRTDMEADQ